MTPLRTALAALLAVVTLAAGCGLADDEPVRPVQINLPDGRQVTVDGTPERIVTFGGQWTDVALAFGVTPVGYYDSYQAATHRSAPWYGDKLADSTVLDLQGDVVGATAALKPDLILAPGFGTSQESFGALAQLAPTIDRVSSEEVDPWQTMVRVMGQVLHRPEKADEIIADYDNRIHKLTTDLPKLAGKTYSFAYMYGNDQFSVLGKDSDGAGVVFGQLGMTLAPKAVEEAARTGQARFALSAENIPWLDSDLLVMATQDEQMRARLEKLPGYRNLRSVRDGAVSQLTQGQIGGLNEPAPLATAYTLDQIRPALQAANDKG